MPRERMSASSLRIVGTGSYLPGHPYTNDDLARVMDTTDAWIKQRTGISQRYYAPEGTGASDLALEASRQALLSAKCAPEDIDYILFATMTPDFILPGSAPLLGAKLGATGTPALDIRQQCAAMIYGLQLADALLSSGNATRILLVGAEAHAGFMPWSNWDLLEGPGPAPSPEAWQRANDHRALSVLFGDGAGAFVLEHRAPGDRGLLAIDLHADGNYLQKLYIPAGFRTRPFISQKTIDEALFIPHMDGRDVFKHAVTKLPKSVNRCCTRAGVKLEDIDLFVAHQANQRINDAVRQALGVPAEKVPTNIARVGNTSAATIPILFDEIVRAGRVHDGMLICFLALGAGLHWGSALFRT
jgi:3-oxoacyl-[acyl-carrier-protein] synthase-3